MFKISGVGSTALIFFILIAFFAISPRAQVTQNAGNAALLVGVGLFVSIISENKYGLKNLIRTDILCLLALYGLTLFEFLFEQEELDSQVSPQYGYAAVQIVLIGIFSFVVGRHLYKPKRFKKFNWNPNLKLLVRLLYICFFLGFFYKLLTVYFNPFAMIYEAMGARFSQPWSRGKYGNWLVFLSELSLFTYAVPPISGILINYRKKLKSGTYNIVMILLLITVIMGFLGGTRNVFFSYLAGLIGGFVLSMPNVTIKKLITPSIIILILSYYAANYMVAFRSIGLRNFLKGYTEDRIEVDPTVFVDYNLRTIAILVENFPKRYDYLGFEVISWALIKPIPRVLFPGKPDGLSTSMEEAAGAVGYTLASTYIGESYMMGGILAVIVVSLFFGYLAAWWNSKYIPGSDYKLLIYALGLFTAAITMRSLFMLTTAILPIIGVNVVMRYLKKKGRNIESFTRNTHA